MTHRNFIPLALVLFAAGLSGCAGSFYSRTCEERGLVSGTEAFQRCLAELQREQDVNDRMNNRYKSGGP